MMLQCLEATPHRHPLPTEPPPHPCFATAALTRTSAGGRHRRHRLWQVRALRHPQGGGQGENFLQLLHSSHCHLSVMAVLMSSVAAPASALACTGHCWAYSSSSTGLGACARARRRRRRRAAAAAPPPPPPRANAPCLLLRLRVAQLCLYLCQVLAGVDGNNRELSLSPEDFQKVRPHMAPSRARRLTAWVCGLLWCTCAALAVDLPCACRLHVHSEKLVLIACGRAQAASKMS
jgi:hypothetical protein